MTWTITMPLGLLSLSQQAASVEVSSDVSRLEGHGHIEVGTHVVWRLRLDDPERDDATVSEPVFGPEWAVVSGPRDHVGSPVSTAQSADVDLQWTLMPLAGGALTTPEAHVVFEDGTAHVVPASAVEVRPSLGETEEVPRPLRGFRDAPDRRVGDPRTAIALLGLLLGLGLCLWLWRRAARRRALAPAPGSIELTPMEQMEALEQSGAPPAAAMAALGPLFRRAFDLGAREDERLRRGALTDDAWALETAEISAGGAEASSLIAELSAYRYGGGEPTVFAVKDAMERARELAAQATSPVASDGHPNGDGAA